MRSAGNDAESIEYNKLFTNVQLQSTTDQRPFDASSV